MKNAWNMILLCGFAMSMFTAGISSSIGPYADNKTLLLLDGSTENDNYEKLSILSSTFAPTALLPFEEFNSSSENSPLRKINQQCIEDSRHYVESLWNQPEWALSMYHASGRLTLDESTNFMISGLGNNVHQSPGLFDQCIASSSPSGRIRGQYCSVFLSVQPILEQNDGSLSIEPKVTIAERPIHLLAPTFTADSIIGFCLPSSCSAEDLRTAVAHKIGRTTFQTKNKNETVTLQSIVTINHDRFCHSEIKIQKKQNLDALCIAFIVISCFIGLLILISTLNECWTRQSGVRVQPIQVLDCFSALRNIKSLLATGSRADDDIPCLHGIRALSFFLIALYHTGGAIFSRNHLYNNDAITQLQSLQYGQPATNLSIIVDTFFLMGGLLVCTSLLKDFDKGRFSLLRFYLHRYLRLTPLYAAIIFFYAAFDSRLGSGPNWIDPLYQSEDCRSYWWSHLLYINTNIPAFMTFCLAETWYLSAEMKMFLFSPIVVYPLWRWPKRAGLILVAVLLAASFGYSTAIFVAWDLPPTVMPTRPSVMKRVSEYFQLYYIDPFARCPPYLFGILLGWVLNKTKNFKVYINKVALVIGWILSIVMVIFALNGPLPYLDEETTPVIDPMFTLIYGVFHRSIWSIAITWIIFLCAKGYGGKVNELLSSQIFVPLAKISFAAYLIHKNILEYYVSQLRIPLYYTPIQIVVVYLGLIVLTLIISAFLTITIEMPFKNLGKFILPITSQSSPMCKSGSTPPNLEGNSRKEE